MSPRTIYLIAAHRRPDLVAALCAALAPAQVLVHIDAKVPDAPFRTAVGEQDGVRFLDERVAVLWAGWSQVETALRLMTAAMEVAGGRDRIVLLSGDSFPLQPQPEIERFFAERPDEQYMSCVRMPVPDADRLEVREFGTFSRLARLQLERDPRRPGMSLSRLVNMLELRRPYRRALGGRTPYGGGQWWALNADAVRWLLAESDRDVRFRRLCRTVAVPDEFYLPTLLMNSPFAASVRRSVMYTDWTRDTGWSPATLLPEHVERFAAAGLAGEVLRDDFIERYERVGRDAERTTPVPVLFARKLDDISVATAARERLWPMDLLDGMR